MKRNDGTLPYSTQHQINLDRSRELYPNGFGRSGMAAIGNSSLNYFNAAQPEPPKKSKNE